MDREDVVDNTHCIYDMAPTLFMAHYALYMTIFQFFHVYVDMTLYNSLKVKYSVCYYLKAIK